MGSVSGDPLFFWQGRSLRVREMKFDLQKIKKVIQPIIEGLGYQLVDQRFVTEHGKLTLRVLVDKEAGLTIDDCAKISREIETPLEVESLISERYQLEVSSPGLDRPLITIEDFRRFSGRLVSIRTEVPIEGRGNYKGVLKGIENQRVTVLVDQQLFQIPFTQVKKANLVLE